MTLSRSPTVPVHHFLVYKKNSSKWQTPVTDYPFFSIMPLQSSSSPRRSDAENTPPIPRLATNKSKVRGGIQGSSRRRRVRSTGGPNHPRYAIGQAKHKSSSRSQHSPVNVQLPSSPEVDVPDPVSTIPVSLPRYLSRPSFRDTAKEAITSVAPELAETHLSYIREGLQCLGPE